MAAANTAVHLNQVLSGEAQQRIRNADDEAELVVLRVIARIRTQHQSEYGLLPSELARLASDVESDFLDGRARAYLSFEDFCVQNSASATELGSARLQAALILARAILLELSVVASGIECWKFVQGPFGIGHIAARFQLSETQKQLLWAEIKIEPGFEGITKPPGTAAATPAGKTTRTRKTPHENPEQLLRGKTRVTMQAAGDILGLAPRSIRLLVEEGKLNLEGNGQRKMITVASLRTRINSPRKPA